MSRLFRLTLFLCALGVPGAFAQTQSQGNFTNGNFETGDFTGWTQGGGYWQGGWPIDPSTYLPGGPVYNAGAIVNTIVGPGPLTDPRTDGNLQIVYSGNKTAKVNDEYNNYSVSVISQTVSNYTAKQIYFAWAAVLQASHGPTDSDNFTLQLKDVTTGDIIYQVAYNSADAASAHLFTHSTSDWYYTSWQVQNLDVSDRPGHTFTLTLLASDCPYGGHAGYVYLDGFGAVTPPTGETGGPLTLLGGGDLGTLRLGNSLSGGFAASGGTPPYDWKTLGTLPAGVTTSGGSLSGIPTQPGNYSVGLLVTDSQGQSVSGTLTFSVFGFTSTNLPPGIVFSPYSASAGVSGGTPPYSFTFSGLPSGISGNTSGSLQGTSNAAGTSQVLVVATDSQGVSASARMPLTFSLASPLFLSSGPLPAGTMGQVYTQLLSGAAGGAPPYSWNVISGSLPDGLILRPGGTVAGNPSRPGTFNFGVRVTDVTGASAAGASSITISPVPLSVAAPTAPAGMSSVEYPAQTFTASGGAPPYTFSLAGGTLPAGVTLDPNGSLSGTPRNTGSFPVTVTATDSNGSTGAASTTVNIRAFSTDLILSAGSVDFTLIAGSSTLPAPQHVAVQSSSAATVISYSVAVSPATANWLTVSPGSSTPGVMNVALNSAALPMPASTTPYQATVSVTCLAPAPCAGNAQTFSVNLTVTNTPPQLSVLSDLISFSAVPGTGQTLTQSVGVQNAGGGSIGFGSVSCAASWCSVSGVPASLTAGQTASFTVAVDPSALTAGYYRTTVTIKASTGSASVPVTIFLASSPSVSLQPAGEQFQALAGGVPNGPMSSFLVDVSGSATVNWSAAVLPGAPWLTLPVSGGTASAAQPGTVAYRLDPGIVAGLTPKTYYGTIRVTVAGVTNSPQDFEVVLNIGPANGTQRPSPSPEGLLFITSANNVPAPQTVTVSTNSVFAVDTQVSVTTTDGGNWLSVTPVTGQAQPGRSLGTQVSVKPANLAPGIYTGGVNYAYSSLAVRTVNVTLIVSPAPKSASKPGLGVEAEAGSCAPTQMAAAPIGLVNSFAQPTAWPTPLQVLLVTDCGSAIPNGQIVATFSNGDAPLPLSLSDSRSGLYSGTWTPRRSSPQTTVTMRATAPGFAPVTLQLGGAITPNAAPLLARNSTQHIYNPLAGGALAPGTLAQIFGTGLASKSAAATGTPLPTSLNGTQVLIGGVPAPVSSVSPGLLNVEIPGSLTPGMQYQVVVVANGAIATPDSLQLTPTAPGIATTAAGFVSASHLDGTPVTQAAPAAPGEALTLLAAGLGLTDTPVPDGTASPASPLANALSTPSITIDGAPAAISFAGLQPGGVGLYQINFTVPTDAKDGDLDFVLSQEGQPGNTGTLSVKKK
jgi:uncharacterized protein (TIGR03437 family)